MSRARAIELFALGALGLATAIVIVPLAFVVVALFVKGAPLLTLAFVSEAPRGNWREGGIMPAIVGTCLLMVGTAALSLPLGVGAAVYLREYAANGRATRLLRLAIMNLAGVPSIVHGLFGLGIFVLLCRMGTSVLAACCTLAILVLPTVIGASEEALRAVPDSLREASEGLGATKRQTIVRVVLPAALPGILTGMILAMGRAAGETAPILFTGAAFFLPSLPRSPFDEFMALPYLLYSVKTEVPKAPEALPYAMAAVLVLVVLLASAAAIAFRVHFRRRSLA